MTFDEAADALKDHVRGRAPLNQLEARDVIGALRFPAASTPRFHVRGRRQWLDAFALQRRGVVEQLLRNVCQRLRRPPNAFDAGPLRLPAPAQSRKPGVASVEQWRAVRQTLEQVFGLGGHPPGPFTLATFPAFDIRWDPPELLANSDANGVAFLDRLAGKMVVGLRTTEEPNDIARTLVHEMSHVSDFELFVDGALTESEMEARAEVLAALHAPRDAVRRRLETFWQSSDNRCQD